MVIWAIALANSKVTAQGQILLNHQHLTVQDHEVLLLHWIGFNNSGAWGSLIA